MVMLLHWDRDSNLLLKQLTSVTFSYCREQRASSLQEFVDTMSKQ